MNVRTTLRASLPYAVSVVGGFLLAYLIVAFFVFPSGVLPGEAKVPNVTGLQFDDAVRRLAERGFKGVQSEERAHASSPKGTVLEQSPAAGKRDVEGAAVNLVVSAGQKVAVVPSIVGLARDAAERALTDAGFDVGDVTERPSDAPRGQVVESRPAPGTKAPSPSTVTFVVSAGANTVSVPNIVGHSVADARHMLEQAGLALGDVNSAYAGNVETAKVTSQSPDAGTQVPPKSKINVVASGGQ